MSTMASKLTPSQVVAAKAFELAIPTVAGRGERSFSEMFPRAEEIERWLLDAPKRQSRPSGDGIAERLRNAADVVAPPIGAEGEGD